MLAHLLVVLPLPARRGRRRALLIIVRAPAPRLGVAEHHFIGDAGLLKATALHRLAGGGALCVVCTLCGGVGGVHEVRRHARYVARGKGAKRSAQQQARPLS